MGSSPSSSEVNIVSFKCKFAGSVVYDKVTRPQLAMSHVLYLRSWFIFCFRLNYMLATYVSRK